MAKQNRLGTLLLHHRQRMDPAAFGFSGRRRTPGLRREEVAKRADISTTWYTWLEQGRGGPPSESVLDRLSDALLLTDAEREHVFLVGLGRPPKARASSQQGVTPRLQRFLDELAYIPAIVATAHWDIVAWNAAARAVLTDYDAMSANQRNILIRIFLDPSTRRALEDWQSVARYLVATFRAETARIHDDERANELIEELSEKSAEFRTLWAENEVSTEREGIKRLHHAVAGTISLEFSSFAVDGRPDLRLLTYTPANDSDKRKILSLCRSERR